MFLFLSNAREQAFWPLLIWSYGVALGPWMYLAHWDQGSEAGDYSAWTTLFAEVSYVVTGLVVAVHGLTLRGVVMTFGSVMLVGMLLQVAWWFTTQTRSRYPRGVLAATR
jgi:hypothetical protein